MARNFSNKPHEAAPIPQDGEIDGKRLDVAAKRRRKRLQDRPEPADELKAGKVAARRRATARPYPPGIKLEPAGFDEEHWTAPHNDTELWQLQLADAFGTRSQAVMGTFLEQIQHLCSGALWDEAARQWRVDEVQFSAMLALINTIKPRNEIEAAFAAQMVSVHFMQMKLAARALRYETDVQSAAIAGKLARTFAMQIETLQGLKGRKRTVRQSIKVSRETHHHQHIHVHRGPAENGATTHDTTAEPTAQRPALLSDQQGGEVVRLPSRSGKARLS